MLRCSTEKGPHPPLGSDTRILLKLIRMEPINMTPRLISLGIPIMPILTHAILFLQKKVRKLNIRIPFSDLERQARRSMPGDMAMHDPDAGIVRLESESKVAFGREQRDISSRRIIVFESSILQVIHVELAVLLCEKHKVVTVEMDWVSDGSELALAYCVLLCCSIGGND